MSTTEQAVVEEVDAGSQETPAEAENAQDDLDTLLAEYSDPPEETPPPAAPAPATDENADIRAFMAEQNRRDVASGLSESAQMIKAAAGEAAANLPDYLFEAELHRSAFTNSAITRAFDERGSKPEGWKKITDALGRKMAKDLAPTDGQSTDSWNAVESAVHSASTSRSTPDKPLTAKELRDMPDADFAALQKSQGFTR